MLVSSILGRIVFVFILQVKGLLLILHIDLVSLIYQLLFALNVLEHVVTLRDCNIVREHLRVMVIELEHSWQSFMSFLNVVEPL